MENVTKIVILIASLVLTLLVIVLGFTVYRSTKGGADSTVTDLNNTTTTFSESRYTDYDGVEVSGSTVQSVVNTYANDEICITVVTLKPNTTSYNYTDTTLATKATVKNTSCQNKSNANYINPSGKFLGEVERDATGTIVGLKFTQQ